jgi:hypothetical protein
MCFCPAPWSSPSGHVSVTPHANVDELAAVGWGNHHSTADLRGIEDVAKTRTATVVGRRAAGSTQKSPDDLKTLRSMNRSRPDIRYDVSGLRLSKYSNRITMAVPMSQVAISCLRGTDDELEMELLLSLFHEIEKLPTDTSIEQSVPVRMLRPVNLCAVFQFRRYSVYVIRGLTGSGSTETVRLDFCGTRHASIVLSAMELGQLVTAAQELLAESGPDE